MWVLAHFLDGTSPGFYMRWADMSLILSFSIRCLRTASNAEPLRLVPMVTVLTVNHFLEGRGGVKILLLRDRWLNAVDEWLNGVQRRSISDRRCSISGDHGEPLQKMLTSTLLKRETFMVLFLKYVFYRQWIFLSLARDAYNAYSRKAGHCQGLFFQYQKLKGSWDKSYWNNTCLGD